MKVLLFTHKNDIDGMGNAILGQLAFKDFTYELCATFDLTKTVLRYFEDGSIYTYDKIFITDLCPEDPILTMLGDEKLQGKVQVLDHHKTYDEPKYKEKPFKLLSLEEYTEITCKQIANLRPDIILHRLSADAKLEDLVEPLWTRKKLVVMNEIDKYLRKHNIHQGDNYKSEE